MCIRDRIYVIDRHSGHNLDESELVQDWKDKYLDDWDETIEYLECKPGFKKRRRAIIIKTFDKLINHCKNNQCD